MTKRELLENYQIFLREIKSVKRQINLLNEYIGGPQPVRSPQLTGMPRGTNEPEAAIMQQVDNSDDIFYMLDYRLNELLKNVSESNKIIESITDQLDKEIIRKYYALGWTDKHIGESIGFDKSTIWKRRTRVITGLD